MEFRRVWFSGGCYFFTVVTYKRQPILTIPDNISRLRKAFCPHSSFKMAVKEGLHEIDWGSREPDTIDGTDFE
jgi:REP element-mobilizing transposase RayT